MVFTTLNHSPKLLDPSAVCATHPKPLVTCTVKFTIVVTR